MSKPTEPRRGDIYLVNFDPSVGAEIQKTRPALVVQNDVANHYSAITIVAALTSQFRRPLRPVQVLVSAGEAGLVKDSVVLLNQIRSIDKQRLAQRLGTVKAPTLAAVDRAMAISLGLQP